MSWCVSLVWWRPSLPRAPLWHPDGVGVDAHIGGRDDIIARCRSTDLPARWRHVHLMGIDFVFVSSEQRLLTVL